MRLSLLALAGVAPSLCATSAVRHRYRPADVVAKAADAAHPLITTAPVPRPFERRLQHLNRRAVSLPACAKSCIDSAISDDTTCTVSDFACGCQTSNALAIEMGASACVESACGYLTALDAWETLEDICLTYALTEAYTVAYTAPTVDGGDGTTVRVTSTKGGAAATATSGNAGGSTTTVTAGAGGSSGSSSGDSSGSSSSSSKSLSTGAIVGIAIGAAGGAILLCALLFLVYRYTKRNNAAAAVASGPSKASEGGAAEGGVAAASTIPHAPSPMPAGGPPGNAADVSPMSAAAVPVSGVAAGIPVGQSELDGKSSAFATTVGTTPTPSLAPPAQSVSPVSAQTAQTSQLYDQNGVPFDAAAMAAWQQQQQQQLYQQQYAQQQYAQQYAAQQQQYAAQYAAAQQQPYIVQGYSIAPGQAPQPQTVVAPAGYAAAHPSQPVPGVVYQEAAAGIPQSHYPQELSSGQVTDVGAEASPAVQQAVPVAVGPSAALPVASTETAPVASPAATTATVSEATPETAPAEVAREASPPA